METRTLTDPPEVVQLKLEFRKLDELTEELKELKRQYPQAVFPHTQSFIQERKAKIAHAIAGL